MHRCSAWPFVLSLVAPDGDENFYNATVAQLGALVENAIDIDVETVLEQRLNGE